MRSTRDNIQVEIQYSQLQVVCYADIVGFLGGVLQSEIKWLMRYAELEVFSITELVLS